MEFKQWSGFDKSGEWTKEIDVRGFIRNNYTPYEGDGKFLADASEKTKKLFSSQNNRNSSSSNSYYFFFS